MEKYSTQKVDINKRMVLQVNYGDGAEPPARGGGDDGDWQDDMSNYNSDFSVPSDDDNDDGDFDDRNADIDMPGRRGGRGQKSQKVRKRCHQLHVTRVIKLFSPIGQPTVAAIACPRRWKHRGARVQRPTEKVLPQRNYAVRNATPRRLQHAVARQGPQGIGNRENTNENIECI